MGCNQSKVKFQQVFKRKRATKRTSTWYVEFETEAQCSYEFSSPINQTTPQKTAPKFTTHHENNASPLTFMMRKDSEWVELYDQEELITCLKTCLNYEGVLENGTHVFMLTPRQLLEMKTYENQCIYELPWKGCMALEYFISYIQKAIETKVENDPFVIVFEDIDNEPGCSKMCTNLIKKTCQRLQMRFKGGLEKVYVYRPSGLLARELSVRKLFNLPFVSYEIENKLVIANNEFSMAQLTKTSGLRSSLQVMHQEAVFVQNDEIQSPYMVVCGIYSLYF